MGKVQESKFILFHRGDSIETVTSIRLREKCRFDYVVS